MPVVNLAAPLGEEVQLSEFGVTWQTGHISSVVSREDSVYSSVIIHILTVVSYLQVAYGPEAIMSWRPFSPI
jgi:hypothetical protein